MLYLCARLKKNNESILIKENKSKIECYSHAILQIRIVPNYLLIYVPYIFYETI